MAFLGAKDIPNHIYFMDKPNHIFRHVPILGSFYNWISPVPEEAKVTTQYVTLYNSIQLSHASKTKKTTS